MYRRYYSYSDMPQRIVNEQPQKNEEVHKKPESVPCKEEDNSSKILGRFDADDVILAIIILALLIDDGDDNLLLLALAFIFITGII